MKFLLVVLVSFHSIISAFEPVILLFGPPGAGKGTFSQYLCSQFSYRHVSAGDLVRSEIERQTPIGLKIAETVKRGEYIEKDIMHRLISQEIVSLAEDVEPFIIDAFSRDEEDFVFLCQLLDELDLKKRALAVYLDAEDEECIERISQRLVCPQCNHVFNKKSAPPDCPGICNLCGSSLKLRINDTPEIIKKRVRAYRSDIEPFLLSRVVCSFPSIFFCTSKALAACLEEYARFAIQIKSFSGTQVSFQGEFYE